MAHQPIVATQVSPEQILGYLRRSDRLNTLYTGPDWINLGWGRFLAAADQEFDEFMSELTEKWKWYSTNPRMNRNKALFELVDWFLFFASAFHARHKTMGLDELDSDLEVVSPAPRPKSWSNGVEGVMLAKASMTQVLCHCIRVDLLYYTCHGLNTFLEWIGATAADFDQAYEHKYQLCLQRVAGGILTGGSYRKDDEVYPEILK